MASLSHSHNLKPPSYIPGLISPRDAKGAPFMRRLNFGRFDAMFEKYLRVKVLWGVPFGGVISAMGWVISWPLRNVRNARIKGSRTKDRNEFVSSIEVFVLFL